MTRLDKIGDKKYVVTMQKNINHPLHLTIQKGTPKEIFKKIHGRSAKSGDIINI